MKLSTIERIYTSAFEANYPELKQLLLTHGEVKKLSKGDFVVKEGEEANGFYWVLSGGAKVCIQTGLSNEQIITILSKTDFVGISAVMNDHNFGKSAIVVSDEAEVLFISKIDFLNFLQLNPMVVIPLLKHIESKIDRIESRAAQIMRKNIEQRLAYVFLMLQKKFGCDENGYLKFQLSPKELANFIGTTRTTVYRVLRRFQDAKLVLSEHKRVQILKAEGLHDLYNNQLELA